jgi:SAM-dependent methyltransferase
VSTGSQPSLFASFRQWWSGNASRHGVLSTLRTLLSEIWDFVRESTPERRRRRYGDVEYDWNFPVDTTSATVSFRNRLLGVFHSAYQPTEPALFDEIMGAIPIEDPSGFVFVDLGSGKGRTLLMASDYPFHRVIGVELLPDLNRIAQENIRKVKSESQHCLHIESICLDARQFVFPKEPTVLYLFHPFPEAVLEAVIDNLNQSLLASPRPVFVVYVNPLLESLVLKTTGLKRIGGTQHYAIYQYAP